MTGTVTRLDANGFGLASDQDSANTAARVETTSSTRYTGLGVDASVTQTGASGFKQLRVGDRVTVSGTGGPAATIRANAVTLIGRAIETRSSSGGVLDTNRFIEGRVTDMRSTDQSFVLESDSGVRTTIVGNRDTPVTYRGETARIANLERGDRVRVEIDARLSSGEVRARSIEVLEDSTPDDEDVSSVRSQNYLTGRVTRVESGSERFTVNADRAGQVRIDARNAVDKSGRDFRVRDLQVGDRLRVWGRYTSQQEFRADRIEFGTADDVYADDEFRDRGEEDFEGFSTVVFYGTIEKNPPNEDKITVRDRDSDRDIEIIADEEFVVLRDSGTTFLRAAQLRSGDRVVVKAFRDQAGNYVAQTIRLQ
ncbi:MAG TPA: DUF5666 domain-containing protein [Thermoanaerobaculia bacterium]|nr:DUF5666 domain-containing protein [Thermoanaerobaculia bacterium]